MHPAEIRLEAFARQPATLTVMKIKRAGVRTILKQIAQRGDRSVLFHWMVEHHDEILDRAKGGKLIWGKLCVKFREHGLTNQLGQPVSERTARETWYQVRKVVAQRRADAERLAATGLAPRSLMPSASPRARTPIEHTRSPSSTAPATDTPSAIPLPNTGSDAPASAGGRISAEQAAAKKARLMRTLAERSGR
jgi:hypothetical protein